MVFKGRFFSSKKSDSSSPDGSNSPRTPTRDSPSRSEKKKVKPSKDDASGGDGGAARQALIGDAGRRQPHQQQEQQLKKKEKGPKGKEPGGSLTAPAKLGGAASVAAAKNRLAVAEAEPVVGSGMAASGSGAFAPILASSLGLNRIKTRSGPLPMEGSGAGGGLRGDHRGSNLGPSNFSRGPPEGCSSSSAATTSSSTSSRAAGVKSAAKKKGAGGPDKVTNTLRSSWWIPEGETSRPKNFSGPADGRVGNILANADSPSAGMGTCGSVQGQEGLRNFDACSPATECSYHECETPKESESPRFKAIMLDTSAPRKRFPADIKSFSHELNSKGVRPYPFWKPRGINNLKEVLKIIHMKFEKAKDEVNSDLAIFAGELVGIMEKSAESHPEWKETLEDLLLLARSCVITSPGDFWLQCEGIVQDLDDRRQELDMGVLKKLHTRMLFILTRCTRLLQFHKESVFAEDEITSDIRGNKIKQFSEKRTPSMKAREEKTGKVKKDSAESGSSRKSYSQEQHILSWRRSHEIKPATFFPPPDSPTINDISPSRERISSWKILPPPALVQKEVPMKDEPSDNKDGLLDTSTEMLKSFEGDHPDIPESNLFKDEHSSLSSKHQHKTSWGYWGDQQGFSDDQSIMCRICEEYVPTSHVEDHLRVCTVVDRCDQKGLSVDERLIRIAETLEKLGELCSAVDTQNSSSPDPVKVNSGITEASENPSPKLSDCPRLGSADMLDCYQEVDSSIFVDDLKAFPSMTCKTRFGPKSDQGMATSSAGSMTPRSPLLTPRTCHIESILNSKGVYSEGADHAQITELADIARCVANAPIDDENSLQYLVSCLEDLQEVVDRRKFEALTVQTFGARIEKLHREKYLQLCDAVNIEKTDASCTALDEEEDVVRSLRTSPVHPSIRDRTSIDDFEIIKPISRGAFGRVFLAKKRTTGDLFAIKVLKKADMIRKNAVESILAERDILISVRNPFVVRFFYSFTSRENLYLVMEYLNGGDLYSLLRNLGCLDEEVARIYIAEVVLALEYLHSLRVVHRDLKPDNLLIAHDGHIKLTDFGLSKVGLINSTDDLSGPAVSGTSLMGEDEPQPSISEHQRERHKKRSAVGTPDYLAPEILLGTGHGATADWWSVGVILFELIVGIPPFNAEHPQTIFDNILNCKIPWPAIPEEMSFEAQDLIDKLLTEDPNQRLGAKGASEVKQHVFFKDINWDTLARQKAAFVPSSDSALDTSYFTSRYSWNPSDERIHEASEFEDSSDNDSMSGSSSCVSNHHEPDECEGLAEFESASVVNYSFSNFSFKNLSQLASINYDLLSKGCKEESPTSSKM